MPPSISDGTQYHFTINSQLTVQDKPAPVAWDASASVADGKLTGTAVAHVKMSTWGIGPITPSLGVSHPPSPVPYRKLEINTALNLLERKKLSRAHRRLLLLIDGQRSTQELARLMGRDEKEVQVLLNDLKQSVIIEFCLI